MTTPSPQSLQEEAELALQEKAWTNEEFLSLVNALNRSAKKIPNPKILIHDLYPNGNYGSATLKIDLPRSQNEVSILTVNTGATVLDSAESVGLDAEISLTLTQENLQLLATFLSKAVVRLEDLPEE